MSVILNNGQANTMLHTPRAPLAPLTHIPREIACVADYERYARERLDANAWAYLSGGAGDELTVADNRRAFERWQLWPRVLNDVSAGHTALTVCGQPLAHPILLAPVAYQRLFHPDGELASMLGAAAMDTPMVVSTLSSIPLETLAQHAETPLWFQLYAQAERAHTLDLMQRAEAAGYRVLVVTVDAPLAGIRCREHRAGFALPAQVSAANLAGYPSAPVADGVFAQCGVQGLSWADLDWLLAHTRLPVLVKGVLHPDDARRAVRAGAAGVVVSNHGGRTLDTLPASLDVLAAVVEALAGEGEVLLDGGVLRGGDVFKALALGARAVLLGRAYLHALAAAGALGVAHALRTLREELEVTMALCGCATLADIGPSALRRPV